MRFLNITCFFLFMTCISCSTEQQLVVGEVINITNDNQVYSVSTIAVNPLSPENMVVAVMRWEDLTEGQFKYNVTTYISDDAGLSWEESILPTIEGQRTSIGASVLYSEEGRVYISYSASVRLPDRRGTVVVVHSSDDNGRTWANTTTINTRFNELPKLTIDKDENIYISTYGSARDSLLGIENPRRAYALIVGKSTDSGKTFDLQGITLDNDLNLGAFTLISFSDGELWFPFTQFHARDTTETTHSSIYGTRIFKNEVKIEDIDRVVITKRKISYNVNLAVDKSPLFKDRVYMAYSIGPRDSLQTGIIYSKDRGKSWSSPDTLKAANKGHFSRLPKVAVSKEGVVGMTWVQTEAAGSTCWKVYFSYSKDGGDTFSEPVAISKIACPNSNEVESIGNGFLSTYYTYGGDYMGLSATDNGFQAAWVDMSNNNFQLYTANIDLGL